MFVLLFYEIYHVFWTREAL